MRKRVREKRKERTERESWSVVDENGREREGERGRERERERREKKSWGVVDAGCARKDRTVASAALAVCVCVCEGDRERERESMV